MQLTIKKNPDFHEPAFGKISAMADISALAGFSTERSKKIVNSVLSGDIASFEVSPKVSPVELDGLVENLRENHLTVTEDGVRTVKVKIAVAVDSDGNWNAVGWNLIPPKKDVEMTENQIAQAEGGMMDDAVDCLSQTGEARYWVEAELPLPTIDTVDGEVKGG